MAYPVRLRWADSEAWVDTIITKPIESNSTLEQSFGRLLGRNFMSHFTVAFDGPAQ